MIGNLLYPKLPNHVFMSIFNGYVISLNIKTNKYHVFNTKESTILIHFFSYGRTHAMLKEEFKVQPKLKNQVWGTTPCERFSTKNSPLEGMKINSWNIEKNFITKNFISSKIFCSIKILHHVHSMKENLKISRIFHEQERINRKVLPLATKSESIPIIKDLNRACLLYPKKTKCLEWAMAMMFIAEKIGVGFTLNIGVQAYPFHAHAWLEDSDGVVGDDLSRPAQLSIIRKI